jgi:hypothetical protein
MYTEGMLAMLEILLPKVFSLPLLSFLVAWVTGTPNKQPGGNLAVFNSLLYLTTSAIAQVFLPIRL